MSKKEYSHGEHMAEMARMTTLYDVIIMIQSRIEKQKIIIAKLDKAEKEYKNVE
jgi:hypothetical protein